MKKILLSNHGLTPNYNDIYTPKSNIVIKFLKETKSIPIYKFTTLQMGILLVYFKNLFGPYFFRSEFL
jgi:hypothetical protein